MSRINWRLPCLAVFVLTLLAQGPWQAWPFIRYDMFVHTVDRQLEMFHVQKLNGDSRIPLKLRYIAAPFRLPEIQKLLRSRYSTGQWDDFCSLIMSRVKADVEIVRLVWDFKTIVDEKRVHSPIKEVLHKCELSKS